MTPLEKAADSECNRVHITALKAMELGNSARQSLVKVETDAGICGYGEAGASGPTTRANLGVMERILLGEDPLAIDKLFNLMTSQMHTYRCHVPTVSGVDIALWDLAGKILNRPVCELLSGKFRDEIPMYYSGTARDVQDPASCAEWAQWIREHPHGYTTLKCGGVNADFVPPGRYPAIEASRMVMARDLAWIRRAHENLREALGFDYDMIIHHHNEWELAAAVGLSQAVEGIRPLWVEDPLPVWYSESWKMLRQASPVRIVTGEKLELAREFLPFLSNGVLDGIHPDLCFAGGITGCRKIADLAEMFYLPVATHNVGSAVQNAATAHFGASTRSFLMSETRLYGRSSIHDMIEEKLVVEGGELKVFDGPGLGITLIPEVLRAVLKEGEPYWD